MRQSIDLAVGLTLGEEHLTAPTPPDESTEDSQVLAHGLASLATPLRSAQERKGQRS